MAENTVTTFFKAREAGAAILIKLSEQEGRAAGGLEMQGFAVGARCLRKRRWTRRDATTCVASCKRVGALPA